MTHSPWMLSTVHTAVLSSLAALVAAFKKQLLAAKASREVYAQTLNEEEIAAIKKLNENHRVPREKLEKELKKERGNLHAKYAINSLWKAHAASTPKPQPETETQ